VCVNIAPSACPPSGRRRAIDSAFTASVAPDADLLSQVEPVLEHFLRKYGAELAGTFAAA